MRARSPIRIRKKFRYAIAPWKFDESGKFATNLDTYLVIWYFLWNRNKTSLLYRGNIVYNNKCVWNYKDKDKIIIYFQNLRISVLPGKFLVITNYGCNILIFSFRFVWCVSEYELISKNWQCEWWIITVIVLERCTKLKEVHIHAVQLK